MSSFIEIVTDFIFVVVLSLKADVWSMGITAIEMAEMLPPFHNTHPMRVLFMIPRNPAPKLSDATKWSETFQSFLALCLTKDPRARPTPTELLMVVISGFF